MDEEDAGNSVAQMELAANPLTPMAAPADGDAMAGASAAAPDAPPTPSSPKVELPVATPEAEHVSFAIATPSASTPHAVDIDDAGATTPLPAIGNPSYGNHADSSSTCFGNSISSQSTLPPATPSLPSYSAVKKPNSRAAAADPAQLEAMMARLKDGANSLRHLTPRTIEACSEEGIEPSELLPKTVADFAPKDKKLHLKPQHQQARYDRFEHRRLSKLSDVVCARSRLLEGSAPESQPSVAVDPQGGASSFVLVEERRRRAEESRVAEARRMQKSEEAKAAAAAILAETARRGEEADRRIEDYERQRARQREQKNAQLAEKRELRESLARSQLADSQAKVAIRAAEAAAHEVRRTEMMEVKRKTESERRREQCLVKLSKAEAAQVSKTMADEQRKQSLGELLSGRQVRLAAHAEQEEAKRIALMREGIALHEKAQNAMLHVDQQRKEFEEKTQAHIDRKSDGNAVRQEMFEQRQKQQAAHSKAVLTARLELDKRQEQEAQKLLQQSDSKQQKRQATLAARAHAAVDAAELLKAKHEELQERVLRQAKKRDHEREKVYTALKAKDDKYFAQVAALEQLQQEKMAVRHKMEAEALRNGETSMRDIERVSEPGPTSYDNRFFETGQLGPGGKYARVGKAKAPPAYSFGTRAEYQLPRVPTDESGKCLTVEIIGKESPGPGTALQELGSRDVLDKTGKFPRSASWSMGKLVPDISNKDILHRPGPGETHAEDKQLSRTKYPSAPSFSFGTRRFQEIREREQKALAEQRRAGVIKPSTADAAYARRNRGPGPTTYNSDKVQTSLARHRSLADGVGVSQRFAKSERFIPLDEKPKDEMGPTTFANKREARMGPGPQKYRPVTPSMGNRSYLSTPLSF